MNLKKKCFFCSQIVRAQQGDGRVRPEVVAADAEHFDFRRRHERGTEAKTDKQRRAEEKTNGQRRRKSEEKTIFLNLVFWC